ncbi:GerAB/ArcD/ProY family transporter [Brevibacillus thermoruber]|jgi:spore germination protein KB|uniref:GerAB/ArcD/ProY family transporter n=1 Tax=Brevibacillus thermoruber TaxID=33942 RepID=UPI000A7DD0F0|nr:endospore germination permease [Brevibacillus thermoruber]
MIEKGKISASQMGIMMYPTIVATALLWIPEATATKAGRDMWISPILASLAGFLTVYVAVRLNKMYPKETILQYSEQIVGRILGKCIGFVYLLFFLQLEWIVMREYGEVMVGQFLPRTPMIVILGSMLLVCASAVRGGVEVLGRAAQFFVPLFILVFGAITLLLVPDLEPENMLPVLEKGILPAILGAVEPLKWFGEFIVISFMLPFLTDRERGMTWGMITVIATMVTMAVINLVVLWLFGEITASLTYPLVEAVRYISMGDFLEHIESLVMTIWVAGTFVKIAVIYYVLALGTAQWLNLADYRPVVFPIGMLLIVTCIWPTPNLADLAVYLKIIAPIIGIFIQTLLPLLLLIIAVIRKQVANGGRAMQKG